MQFFFSLVIFEVLCLFKNPNLEVSFCGNELQINKSYLGEKIALFWPYVDMQPGVGFLAYVETVYCYLLNCLFIEKLGTEICVDFCLLEEKIYHLSSVNGVSRLLWVPL